jgi:hypothetical protein
MEEQRFLIARHHIDRVYRWLQKTKQSLNGYIIERYTPSWLSSKSKLGDHVQWLCFEDPDAVLFPTFCNVIQACPALYEIHMHGFLDQRRLDMIAAHCTQLRHLAYRGYGCKINGKGLLNICMNCEMLEHLDLSQCNVSTESDFVSSVSLLPRLTFLSCCNDLQTTSLTVIGQACPHLQTFITGKSTTEPTVAYMLHYAQCFPQLTSFGLRFSDLGPDWFVVLQLCPKIKKLTVSHLTTAEYAARVLSLYKQLTEVSVMAANIADLCTVLGGCEQLQKLTLCGDPPYHEQWRGLRKVYTKVHTLELLLYTAMPAEHMEFMCSCIAPQRVDISCSFKEEEQVVEVKKVASLVPGVTIVVRRSVNRNS